MITVCIIDVIIQNNQRFLVSILKVNVISKMKSTFITLSCQNSDSSGILSKLASNQSMLYSLNIRHPNIKMTELASKAREKICSAVLFVFCSLFCIFFTEQFLLISGKR